MHAQREGGTRGDIATVQALRAAACLLVVAYHALDAWGGRLAPPRDTERLWPNGAAGVDLFFVISGFVMAVSSRGLVGPNDARRFLVRRLRRLVPLYWGLTTVKLAILAMVAGPMAMPSLWRVAASFLFVPARDAAGAVRPVLGVGWTLQFEMLFYLLFAAAVWRRRVPGGAVLKLLLCALLPLALAGFFRRTDWPAPVGEASYAIYLVHPFLVPLLARLTMMGHTPPDLALPVLLAASLAASALAGLVLHALVDRPVQRWLAVGWGGARHVDRGALSETLPHLVQP